jgi:parvulin-like peptidyl-prolyl isomerase
MQHRWVMAACLAAAASTQAAPVGSVADIDRSVARVGDYVIWETELAARAQTLGVDRAKVLEELIEDALIVTEARRQGVIADKDDVDGALVEIKQQNNLDDAGLDKALAAQGYTRARYRVDLERQILILRAKNQLVAPRVFVTNAEVDAEAKQRNLANPTEDDRNKIRGELRKQMLEIETKKWIGELRKRAWIERRP